MEIDIVLDLFGLKNFILFFVLVFIMKLLVNQSTRQTKVKGKHKFIQHYILIIQKNH